MSRRKPGCIGAGWLAVLASLVAMSALPVLEDSGPGSSAEGAERPGDGRPAVGDPVEEDWIQADRVLASSAGGEFSLGHTRAVLDRGRRALDATLVGRIPGEEVSRLRTGIDGIRAILEETGPEGTTAVEERRALHLRARAAVREIVLRNPLLDFDRLLFVKRFPGRFPHMCDQYYGSFARPGGGLFVLEGTIGGPRVREILPGRLPEGSYLSPDLSTDATRVLFAHAKARRDGAPGAIWTSDVCYHIYVARVDGTEVRQLTDGPHDDFDPCWLPDGKIVFISTRRGGYCRCGDRPVPTYTLHVMDGDGTGLRCVSYHETNEWHPALLADGRIVYTRWDYVDRHTNVGHSLWTVNPDGSSPVAIFGNYNFERRPWGEWNPVPVPGSRKILAVAGAHHGYAHGSLVLIDPERASDGSAAIARITPDVPFPEAEGYPSGAYATPFALSEDLWLASYSPRWSTRDASYGVTPGLYVIDSFGNRELLYRDPAIPSMDPIPLRPRAMPRTYCGGDGKGDAGGPHAGVLGAEGEFLLLDVYRSVDEIPRGAVKSLRIVQILPKTTIRNDDPKISVAKQISARYVLGTVPVEEDGSAYFRAPAGVPLYFQALGADGAAWQSMRSITYLQPGERRSCAGCHESRLTSPPNRVPLAARRAPSSLEPGPDGTKPFSYPRLVQPVLDRRCVSCHGEVEPDGGIELTGRFTPTSGPHTASYAALGRKELVPWFDSINGNEWLPRTYPGKFGARASRLYPLLRDGHEGVRLDPEELERIAIWIDLNVPFYGAYEPAHVAAQREGREVPLDEILK